MSVSSTEGVGTSYFGTPAATVRRVDQRPGSTGSHARADAMNKDMFLKLMVAQLKYQDPMNPTDSCSSWPRRPSSPRWRRSRTSPTRPARRSTAQMAFGASSLVGRTVTYTDADGVETAPARSTPSASPPPDPLLGVGGAEVALASVVKVAS